MNELTAEVKAKEIHEQAVSYFNVSEQYGYKFIKKVEKIREDRYYKQLGFSSFDDYCLSAWNVTRDFMDQRIQIASAFKEEDFADYSRQFGHKKSLLLSRTPEPQRNQMIEQGIPTDEGQKSINEATQREIADYKRKFQEAEQAKQKAEQEAIAAKRSEEIAMNQLNELENQEPKQVEVVPEDYDSLKGNYSTLKNSEEYYKGQNEELREEISRLEQMIKNDSPNKHVTSQEIEELENKKEQVVEQMNAASRIKDLHEKSEQFIQSFSPIKYSSDFANLKNDRELLQQFELTIEGIETWCREMKESIPNKNIIEGEIINE